MADQAGHRLFLWDGDPVGYDHDYDPEWDYDVEVPAGDSLERELREALAMVERDVLPELGFRSAVVFLVRDGSMGDRVGVYVNGTAACPFIGLSAAMLWRATDRQGFIDEALATVVHELGHACLDRAGIDEGETDCEEAVEEFARRYVDAGKVDVGIIEARIGSASLRS